MDESTSNDQAFQVLKQTLGCAAFLLGLAVAGWICWLVYTLLNGSADFDAAIYFTKGTKLILLLISMAILIFLVTFK